ncbi:hypothetical protein NQ317_001734 [Molorchus minor]|uniref:BLOC-2 complex member HPS3 N-terminal domain-containing protein n=1 Tax=Molorchus minor TaxID=1323400 RepID=A0ABQ9JXK7_9CUCU|nr:hypothetical protein NQ317_001734 [Molorchus minor]
MVRVISVHHFASQHIQTVEQPTACVVAPPNRLLLALLNNCVEVRDLGNESDVLFSFPTVDEVIQIVHCQNGDYVATLETKFNRQNKETNFVRVYINWDSIATLQQSKMTSSGVSLGSSECGMVQPMRARIAGRVTPTTNQSELGSLEMIEIPSTRGVMYYLKKMLLEIKSGPDADKSNKRTEKDYLEEDSDDTDKDRHQEKAGQR